MKNFILASASPRRSAILSQIKIPFRVEPSKFEEVAGDLEPEDRPQKFAEGKALDVSKKFPEEYALGYDTLVYLDGDALGKPKDKADAVAMLKYLNGKRHKVISGVAIARGGKVISSARVVTDVVFRHVTDAFIENYVESGESLDKAGAYAIQGLGASLVKSIHGCYYNVVGLPVAKTLDLIDRLGDENV